MSSLVDDIAIEHIGVFANQGQVCCAGSREFVEESIYDRFMERSDAQARCRRIGDPFDPSTEQGPQVNQTQYGGFKLSGSGRELGEYGLQQYSEVKTVISNL